MPSTTSSSVTAAFEGFFWAVGDGNPSYLQGEDNGAFISGGETGWVKSYPGYPAFIHTTWSRHRLIDGCADNSSAATKCTAVLLTDQSDGKGFFALVTVAADRGNYSLVQPGNAPIVLSALPKPQVTAVTTNTEGDTEVTTLLTTGPGGMYLSGSCPLGVVIGYRIYAQAIPAGQPPPADLRRSEPSDSWQLAEGGQQQTGAPVALGTSTVVTDDCGASQELYLAAALIFESGFETAHLSEPTGPIPCGGE